MCVFVCGTWLILETVAMKSRTKFLEALNWAIGRTLLRIILLYCKFIGSNDNIIIVELLL